MTFSNNSFEFVPIKQHFFVVFFFSICVCNCGGNWKEGSQKLLHRHLSTPSKVQTLLSYFFFRFTTELLGKFHLHVHEVHFSNLTFCLFFAGQSSVACFPIMLWAAIHSHPTENELERTSLLLQWMFTLRSFQAWMFVQGFKWMELPLLWYIPFLDKMP